MYIVPDIKVVKGKIMATLEFNIAIDYDTPKLYDIDNKCYKEVTRSEFIKLCESGQIIGYFKNIRAKMSTNTLIEIRRLYRIRVEEYELSTILEEIDYKESGNLLDMSSDGIFDRKYMSSLMFDRRSYFNLRWGTDLAVSNIMQYILYCLRGNPESDYCWLKDDYLYVNCRSINNKVAHFTFKVLDKAKLTKLLLL